MNEEKELKPEGEGVVQPQDDYVESEAAAEKVAAEEMKEAAPALSLTKADLQAIKKDPKKGPVAKNLQGLIVKLLKSHRVGVERSKQIARTVLVKLRDAQDIPAIDDALKEVSHEYPELKPLFYSIEEGEKREVDNSVADQVIAFIESGNYQEAIDLGDKICHFFVENPEGDVNQLLVHYGHNVERIEHPDLQEGEETK